MGNSFVTNLAQRLQALGVAPNSVMPDSDKADAMLAPYGLKMPTADQINPNVFFPNSGFFGAHPRLTGMLEGALMGGAFTQPAATAGQGITNVLQGLLQARQYKQNNIVQQYLSPFAMAGQMAQLQQINDAHNLQTQQADYYKHHGQYLEDSIQARKEAEFDRLMYQFKPTGAGWEPNPGVALAARQRYLNLKDGEAVDPAFFKDLWTYNKEAGKKAGAISFGPFSVRTLEERQAMLHFLPAYDKDGTLPTPEEWNADVDARINKHAGGKTAATENARQNAGDLPEDLKAEHDRITRDHNGRKLDPENKQTLSAYRSQVMDDPTVPQETKDNFSAAKLEAIKRINAYNAQIDTDRDAAIAKATEEYQKKRRGTVVKPKVVAPIPTARPAAIAPRATASSRPKVSVAPDGTISVQ